MGVENFFASNLKYLRTQKNLNQQQLGKVLNKDYSTIGKWENGSRSPTMEDTLSVCEFFNINLNDLILKNLKIEKNVVLDEDHKLDLLIMDKTKELSEEDKKKVADIIDIVISKEK